MIHSIWEWNGISNNFFVLIEGIHIPNEDGWIYIPYTD
jgi:hypothetical protein